MTVRSSLGVGAGGAPVDGAIVAVASDGTIDSEPVVVIPGEGVLTLAIAPSTFGAYAGQLFLTASSGGSRVASGNVYRLAADGAGTPGGLGIRVAVRDGLCRRLALGH